MGVHQGTHIRLAPDVKARRTRTEAVVTGTRLSTNSLMNPSYAALKPGQFQATPSTPPTSTASENAFTRGLITPPSTVQLALSRSPSRWLGADANDHLAEVPAVEETDEGPRRLLEAIDDVFTVTDASL